MNNDLGLILLVSPRITSAEVLQTFLIGAGAGHGEFHGRPCKLEVLEPVIEPALPILDRGLNIKRINDMPLLPLLPLQSVHLSRRERRKLKKTT
mgnify:FL=1